MPNSQNKPVEKKSLLETLDTSVDGEVAEIGHVLEQGQKKATDGVKKVTHIIGPGVITGFSDDDPSGIGTYAISGAQYGLGQGWLTLFQLPFMIAVQEMCARIGIVTGKGLAGNIKHHFSVKWLYGLVLLLVVANVFNIGADISAMGASLAMIAGGSSALWAIVTTLFIIILEIFISYKVYANLLKWLTVFFLAYVVTAFIIPQDWGQIVRSLVVPHMEYSKLFLITAVGFLGTTISPYLFFWQASEEVEEQVSSGKRKEIGDNVRFNHPKEIKKMRWDTVVGMVLSQLVAFFIVVTTASTLHNNGITQITSAQDAAQALVPLAGQFAGLVFAIGIIGAGLMGIPVLAGSGAYVLSEVFGWRQGLFHKFKEAIGFYSVIIVSTLVGLGINFAGIDPIQGLLYAAVVNGVVAVPLIALILLISNKKEIMGTKKNTIWSNVFGWGTFGLMALAVIMMFWSMAG